jgi:hypothetical protein
MFCRFWQNFTKFISIVSFLARNQMTGLESRFLDNFDPILKGCKRYAHSPLSIYSKLNFPVSGK